MAEKDVGARLRAVDGDLELLGARLVYMTDTLGVIRQALDDMSAKLNEMLQRVGEARAEIAAGRGSE